MRNGSQEILLSLRLGLEDEDVNRQVLVPMRRADTPEAVLDVLEVFSVLSAAEWPGSGKYFRLFVQIYAELWIAHIETLPLVERAVASVEALRVMGMPVPESVGKVAALAQAELERRGVPLRYWGGRNG
ncbi:hypothetical protein [Neorhizobium sp. T7_12]|uniref:hypothetical protein n=1 Tax=Neorhizobium sp. T7_12 TaxID=2093832 RepID=UPI000CF85554|nr:hypothetical protein [Neorhizobium sp. T7_12]